MDSLTPDTIEKLLSLAQNPKTLEVDGRTFVMVPHGWVATDVTPKLRRDEPTPRERRGAVVLNDIPSFTAFVNRMQTPPTTVLFADQTARKITSVFDYHDPMQVQITAAMPWQPSAEDEDDVKARITLGPSGEIVLMPAAGDTELNLNASPNWGHFRAHYEFPLSRQWKIWTDQNSKLMKQAAFAQFIEDNLMDVMLGTQGDSGIEHAVQQLGLVVADPMRLLSVSRSLKITSEESIVSAVNLASGEIEISYLDKQTASDRVTGEKLVLPTAFVIAIPVFEGGAAYRLLVRLRTRKESNAMHLGFDIYQLARSEHDAFATECQAIAANTDLPLFYGVQPDETTE